MSSKSECVLEGNQYPPNFSSCYFSATNQFLLVPFREHLKPSQPVGKHARKCDVLDEMLIKDVKILASTTSSKVYLFTLEALWQKEEQPKINTKDIGVMN